MLGGYDLCFSSHQNIHAIYFLWPPFRIAETRTPQRIWEGNSPVILEFWFIELCQPEETVWYNDDFYCFSVLQYKPQSEPQSDSFSCASFMFSSLLEEIVSTKSFYWASALNLFLEKPFFLCLVLKSQNTSCLCKHPGFSGVNITPSGNWKNFAFQDGFVTETLFFKIGLLQFKKKKILVCVYALGHFY